MITTVLNQGGSTGWFNPAAAIRVESKKPTGFILPAMRKPFCDTHRVRQTCLSYGHTESNFELNCGPTYVFTRGPPSPLFASEPKENLQDDFVGYV